MRGLMMIRALCSAWRAMSLRRRVCCGYTLVELSISTGIIAILAVGGLSAIQKKAEADHLRETRYKIRAIRAALDKFIRINGYAPCPASPSLAQDSPYFGKDKRAGAPQDVSLYDADQGKCTGQDVADDAGMLPVRTLNLSDDFAYDGWDRQFTYRIAYKAADKQEVQNLTYRGNLRVVDLQGNNITDIDNPPPNNHGALYVVISYGPDGKGAAWPKRVSSASGELKNSEKPSEEHVGGVQKQNLRHGRGIYVQDGQAEGFDDIVVFGSMHSVNPPKEVFLPTPLHEDSCGNADLFLTNPSLIGDLPGNKAMKEKVQKAVKELKTLCTYQPKSSALQQSAAQAEGVAFWFDAEKPLSDGSRPSDASLDWEGKNGLTAKRNGGVLYDGALNNRPAFNMHNGAGSFTLDSVLPGMDTVDPNYYFGGTVERNKDNNGNGNGNGAQDEQQQFTFFAAVRMGTNVTAPQTIYASSDDNNAFRIRISGGALVGQVNGVVTAGRAVLPGKTYVVGFSRGAAGVMLVTDREKTYSVDNLPKAEIGETQFLLSGAGGGERFQGVVGEMILFNSQLSEKSFYQNIAALDAKWGAGFSYDKYSPVECPFKGQLYISTSADPDRKCQCPEGTALNTEIPSRNPCLAQSGNIGECVPLTRYSTEQVEQRATVGKPVFTPQQVSGTILWLDGADCSTITLDEKRRVQTWRDKSSAGNDFSQKDPDKRPGYELRLKSKSGALADWNMLRFSGVLHPEYLENTGCPEGVSSGSCRPLGLGRLKPESLGGRDYVGYSLFVAAQISSNNTDKHVTLFNSGRNDWGMKIFSSGVLYGYMRHASQDGPDGILEAQAIDGVDVSLLDYASYGDRTQVFATYMSMPVGTSDWQTHRDNQRTRMIPSGLITISLGLDGGHYRVRSKDSEILGSFPTGQNAYDADHLLPLQVPAVAADERHTIGASVFSGFTGDKMHTFDGRIGEVVAVGYSLLNNGVNQNNANLVRYMACKWLNQCSYTPP